MKLKPVKDLNFLELKKEAKLRDVYVDKMTLSAMTNAVQKHRDENPDFILPIVEVKKTEQTKTTDQSIIEGANNFGKAFLEAAHNEPKKEEMKTPAKKAAKKIAGKKVNVKKAAKKVSVKSKKETIAIDEKALLAKPSVKKIMAMEEPKHKKIFLLNKEGISKNEISIITGATTSNISRDLLFYKKGKY